jgi:O-antigen/teichoic acid export membrane protein
MTVDLSAASPTAIPPSATVEGCRHEVSSTVSLRRNSAWMLAGNAVYAGCQWATLAVLARAGTTGMVGQLVLALSVTTPVMAFFMLQLRTVQATDARRAHQFGEYLALRLATTLMALATLVSIALAYGYRRETALVIVAAAISAAVDSLSDIVYGLLQQHERMSRIAQSLIIKGAVSLVAFSVVVLKTRSAFYGILAIAATRAGVLLLWDLRNAALVLSKQPGSGGLRPRCDLGRLLPMAWLSLPLGVSMTLIVLLANMPRYFVDHYAGERELGIFGAIGYFSVAGTMAVSAMGESVVPRLAQCYSQGRIAAFAGLVLRLSGGAAALGIIGVAVALFVGPQILAIVYGAEYAAHNDLLVWTMVAAAIGYVASFAGYAVTAARYFRIQIPLYVLVVAVTAAACWWLVPRMGLRGAALALCVSTLTQLLGMGLVLAHALTAKGRRPLGNEIIP